MESATIPRWSAPLKLREDNDGVVLVLNHASQTISFLNPSGAQLLRCIDGRTSIETLTKHMSSLYPEVAEPEIERDVQSAIQTFITEGYVTLGTC